MSLSILAESAAGSKNLDFMIHGLYKYKLFGQELYLTTTTVSLLIVVLLITIFAIFANRAIKAADPYNVPSGFVNFLECGIEALEGMTDTILGGNKDRFLNYIGTLDTELSLTQVVGTIFIFIFVSNFSGLLGLRNPTADYGVTFMLGFFTFLIVNFQGIKNRKLKHFTSLFEPIPLLFPINVIGEIANPISISLRLFANVLSGVLIMGLWYGMMPIFLKIGVPSFLHLYTDVFSGALQTYVFCMLSMVYINDKLE